MLSSIHPLGERARHNRWSITVISFALASAATGGAVGMLLGWLGGLIGLDSWPGRQRLVGLGVVVLGAAVADLGKRRVPGPRRQVNEGWIGQYRGWVYGAGFGAQLGVGAATFVVTWGVYASYLIALLVATPLAGAMIGAMFGLGRSLTLWAGGWIDRPSRLSAFHRRLGDWARPARVWISSGYAGLAAGALSMGLRWPF